jgi:hypothetical protein
MATKDVRAESFLTWDEYKNKSLDEALPVLYAHATATSKARCTWYWDSIKAKRWSSLGIRLATFSLLVIGTLLPILAGLGDRPDMRLEYTQVGVTALALAGLLQVADRVFGWSSGWLRYITTVTTMENVTRKFELDWAAYILGKGGNLSNQDIKPLFDMAKQLEDDTAKLQSDETEKWVAEFSSSVALLGEMIKSQRESGEKAVEAARSAIASQQNGAVELSLVHKDTPTTVNIAVDDESGSEFVGSSWAKLDMKPGQHTITVTSTDTTKPKRVIQKVVDVPAGGVARIEITLS